MKTLLLKFAGPLQSWGTSSYFETRHTDFHPSKSAVIGMLAACLGYRRDDDQSIQRLNELDFVVRVDQLGRLLSDFHTARKYNKEKVEHNYVTNRYYLEDAVFVVAVSHADDAFMDMIVEGVRSPYFQPFMGRRSLPVVADIIIGVQLEGAYECLKHLEWQASSWYQKKYSNQAQVPLEVYTDAWLSPKHASHCRKDVVHSFSQKGRQFGFRYEAREEVTVRNPWYCPETEHDIFKEVGEVACTFQE